MSLRQTILPYEKKYIARTDEDKAKVMVTIVFGSPKKVVDKIKSALWFALKQC